MKNFVEHIEHFIKEQQLAKKDDGIIVGVSGGPDSVALLHVLHSLDYKCIAVHCNFCLRGEESDRDSCFVRHLCKEMGIDLYVTNFQTKQFAEKNKISIEMAARELRYDYFESIRKKLKWKYVAVAHHRDDSVETMLLNLIRGTGPRGLTGIHPKVNHLIRPLLCVSRQDIMEYLKEHNLCYVTDSTNCETIYTRNKIRLELLPLMRTINPAIEGSLLKTAAHMNETLHIYQNYIKEATKRTFLTNKENYIEIDIKALLKEIAPKSVLFEVLNPLGFKPMQIEEVFNGLKGRSGATFYAPNVELLINRGVLILRLLTDLPSMEEQIELKEGVNQCGKSIIKVSTLSIKSLGKIPRDKRYAALDADTLNGPLILRHYQVGDRFQPFGMKGFKLVSDYLTDRKFSRFEKEAQCVVCCGVNIVWLLGERPDGRFTIQEGRTHKVVLIEKLENND